MNTPEYRLRSVRTWMAEKNIDAWIQPHEDRYLNEYTAPDAEYLAWLTGFTGSAGVVIVTAKDAYLLTDSRYAVQSRMECPEPLFTHYTLESGVNQWLQEFTQPKQQLAIDARLISVKNFSTWEHTCIEQECTLHALPENPIDTLWVDKPATQIKNALYLPEKFHGCESIDKRHALAEQIKEQGADALLLTKADSICWLLNIRGYDIPCVPVINSLALVFKTGAVAFFCTAGKVNPEILKGHAGSDVQWYDEALLAQTLPDLLHVGQTILFDTKVTTVAVQDQLEEIGVLALDAVNPIEMSKACKNPVELQGMRAAHQRDAIAVCQFLAWIEKERKAQNTLDEGLLADKLLELRQKLDLFQGPSFDTISALGPNAAMCHYNHMQAGARTLQAEDALYLVDSGGQYLDGTTDITRTIQVGKPTAEHKKFFTLVLKGHIQLALQVFPVGTSGVALDAFARSPLWRIGCDFGHGTGHGVGHFLNVHEGPQNISPRSFNTSFHEGMVVSNEPGYYRADAFGIRCENLMIAVPLTEPTEKPMLRFEALTFVPFDTRLIDLAYLNQEETDWLNAYHEQVWELISPHLSGTDETWLYEATRPVG